MSLQEMLKQKAAAASAESSVITGVQGSVEQDSIPSAPQTTIVQDIPEKNLADLYKDYPANSYLMLRSKYIINSKGQKLLPDARNVFVAKTEEQKEILEHLAAQNASYVQRLK